MYVAVKGGEKAIANAHARLAEARRGDTGIPEITVAQIREQLTLAVHRVMAEGSLYDPDLAALALKQARGDSIEAVFLLRAFRTTLPRFGYSHPVDTGAIHLTRRISAAFKDLPGGQLLGPTFDYTHRLLDFSLLHDSRDVACEDAASPITDCGDLPATGLNTTAVEPSKQQVVPRVTNILGRDGLIETATPTATVTSSTQGTAGDGGCPPVGDLTREPLTFPVDRDVRLQNLARADEGFLLSLGYSTQRGFKASGGHPFAGEIRMGEVAVELEPEELGFPVSIGDITLTEAEILFLFDGSETMPPQFMRGYGLSFGNNERRTLSMALVDRALRCRELDEEVVAPAQDEEFVLSHSDNVEATGFVEHLKLPHHVDFQSELEVLRRLRADHATRYGDMNATKRRQEGDA